MPVNGQKEGYDNAQDCADSGVPLFGALARGAHVRLILEFEETSEGIFIGIRLRVVISGGRMPQA